jgi:sporulation protein YlmC with PRC-barrel domain
VGRLRFMSRPYCLPLLVVILALTACTGEARSGQAILGQPENYSSVQDLIGSQVFDREGTFVGIVQDVLINNETGTVGYISLKLKDLYLFGRANVLPYHSNLVLLPWHWVRVNANPDNGLTIQASLEAIYAAPRLEPGRAGLPDRWNANIDRYWAQVK